MVALFGVSVVVFSPIHFAPGDPARLLLPDGALEEDVGIVRKALGLDQPLHVQYGVFIAKAIQGGLRHPLYYKQPALGIILEHLPATIQLTFAALAVSLLPAVPTRLSKIWACCGPPTAWKEPGQPQTMTGEPS